MADQNSPTAETPEDVEGDEYEREQLVTREEGARVLRRLADGVANGSVELGDGGLSVAVPDRFELELEYELEDDEAELEVELQWPIVDGEAVAAERDAELQAEDDTDESDPPLAEVVGGGQASNARFELYRDRADQWRWRLVHDNGNIIATSGEGYERKASARNGLESVMDNAPGAPLVTLED